MRGYLCVALECSYSLVAAYVQLPMCSYLSVAAYVQLPNLGL
jgi:hypothetical protein